MTRLAYPILLILLFLAPLAGLPSVAGLGITALLEAFGICLLLFCLFNIGSRPLWHPTPGLLPLSALAGFLLVQALPLPPFLLRLLSPRTWSLYTDTIWVVRPGVWMPLSFSPQATLTEFFRFFLFAALYLVTVQLIASRERLKSTISPLVVYAGLVALFAIVEFLFQINRPDWLTWQLPTSFRGNFPGLLAMAFPLALAQYLASKPHVSHLSLREKVVNFIRQLSFRPHVLMGFSCLCLVFSILLSRSWAGILSSLGALLVFFLLLLTRRRGRRMEVWGSLVVLGLLFLLGLALAGAGGGSPVGRGAVSGLSVGEKQLVQQDSLKIFYNFPLFGTGAGTFAQVYPRYRTLPGDKLIVDHAYNSFLETLVETGLTGILLFGWFLILVLYRGYLAWRQRHSRASFYLYLGCVSGVTATLLYGWSSPILQVFTGQFYIFFLCGLAIAAATTSSLKGAEPEPLEIPAAIRRGAVSVTVAVLALNLTTNVSSMIGRAGYGNPDGDQVGETAKDAARAAMLDPLAAGYRYALADARLALGDPAGATKQLGAALRLTPLDAEYLQRMGLVLANLGQEDKAERLLREGAKVDRTNPERHKALAFWLLSRDKKEEALDQVRQAIYWGPEKTWDYLTLMALNDLSQEEMRQVLPESSMPMLAFGDYLVSIGEEAAAEGIYRASVQHALTEKHPSPEPFRRTADFFAKRGRDSDALEIILMGIERFPQNPDLRLSAANLYEKLGIVYRAVQEYRVVLAFDQDNEEARERLKVLAGEHH